MTKERLRVGVVGLGKMGLLHSCVLNVLPNVQVAALCEKSFVTRKFLNKVFKGIPILNDVVKLAELDLEAIYVTTPIPCHFHVAKSIYQTKAANNLFVEKTLAQSSEQAKELCELARSFGGVNMVGYLRRFYVTFKKAKDLLAKGAIGNVSSFKAYAYSSDFLNSRNGQGSPALRGGVLRDLGCHAVDMALLFFDELHVCTAQVASSTRKGCDDSVCFSVRNSSELEGEFKVSWRMENYRMPEVGLLITGSEGTIDVNDDRVKLKLSDGKTFSWYRHDLNDNVSFWLGLPEYYREDLHFVESVIGRRKAEPDFHTASKVDEIIDQVEKRAGESG